MLSNLKYRDLSVVSLRKQPTFRVATTIFPRNDFWETNAEIPYWWRVTTQIWVVLLIGWTRFPRRHDQSEALPRSPNVSCFLRLVSGERVNRDFKIRDYRRLDARSPMSGGLDRVRSVVACCGAKTQIKLLHYQLRTTRNCSSRIHFEDVFPKSQRWAYLLFCWWNSGWGRVCFALRCLRVDKFYLSVLGVRRIFAWLAEFRWVSCR